MKLTYTKIGDYYYPNLLPPEEVDIGKYGRLRQTFLQEHKPWKYERMMIRETLNAHLMEIDQLANERMDQLIAQMAKEQNVTEELKASDQMKWVGLMNNIRNAAEEIVLKELIYS